MDITSLHKYISLNKMANGTVEVIFMGQPCLSVSETNVWKINPVFAKLTYGANAVEDIPVCTENEDSTEEAVAAGLVKLEEVGAFKTSVDFPEDTYAATLASNANDAAQSVSEDYSKAAFKYSYSLFEVIKSKNRMASGKVCVLSEDVINSIKDKILGSVELSKDELRNVVESIVSGQSSFISESTGLPLICTRTFDPIVVVEDAPSVDQNVVEDAQTQDNVATTFLSFKARKDALNVSEGFNDDDLYLVNKATKKVVRNLGNVRVGNQYRQNREHAPEVRSEIKHKDHDVVRGSRAKHEYTMEARSEYTANVALSGAKLGTPFEPQKKKFVLKTQGGNNISAHDTESDALRTFKNLSASKGVKIVRESDAMDVTAELLNSVSEGADEDYAKWQSDVNAKHPGKKLKFKGRVEQGNHTTSAEETGKDRSYGVWDHEKDKGHVFESDIESIGEDIDQVFERSLTPEEIAEREKIVKALKSDKKFMGKYGKDAAFAIATSKAKEVS
jgi:hypothetical protein